ncbi:MAG: 5-(carboxyamino)imidazole ribonucleotide mutase [Bacillota bacterium]|nr:5-(carboxyamino)imidazole ribonucleotide mutase [Bacillota bacterium]
MKVSMLMGSDSDFEVAKVGIETLKDFGVAVDVKVLSAHRTPVQTHDYIKEAEKSGTEVFIALAGKAAHLAGAVAAGTIRPVIGVPIKSSHLGGLEALLSTVEMPSGVPVATVAINGAQNAALLAVQMLANKYPELDEKLRAYKAKMEREVLAKNPIMEG